MKPREWVKKLAKNLVDLTAGCSNVMESTQKMSDRDLIGLATSNQDEFSIQFSKFEDVLAVAHKNQEDAQAHRSDIDLDAISYNEIYPNRP